MCKPYIKDGIIDSTIAGNHATADHSGGILAGGAYAPGHRIQIARTSIVDNTALWNDGIKIWDIGGGNSGGSVANPVPLGSVVTQGGKAHNVWWFHNQANGEKRFAFVGEEAPGSIGASTFGDIHVVDVSNFASPREVAFFHLDNAGTHNFSLQCATDNGGGALILCDGDSGVVCNWGYVELP